ncbi:MAG: DUF2219 family protein, partial [Rhodospirillales bacterium]|nr:DUF2219 family protein [Rhodospirillales bacterium]
MTACTESDSGISRHRAGRRLAAGLAAALAWVTPASADEPGGNLSLQLENDRIANTDRHYTHGSRLSWVSNR